MKNALLILCLFVVMMSTGFAAETKKHSTVANSITSIVKPEPATKKQGPRITVTAEIAEDITVTKITLFYRAIGHDEYNSTTMHADKNGEYRYSIKKAKLDYPGLEYYIVAFDLRGNSLLHGNANIPLVVNFENGWSSTVIVENSGQDSDVNRKVVRAPWRKEPSSNSEPIWKNKWLWIGVGVLAAVAIDNGNDSEPAGKPGFSVTIEGEQPTPTTSQ